MIHTSFAYVPTALVRFAVNDISRELDSAIGIAVLGSVLNGAYQSGIEGSRTGLPTRIAQGIRESIAFVQSGVVEQFGSSGANLVASDRQSEIGEYKFIDHDLEHLTNGQ